MIQNGVQILPVQWRKDLELSCDFPGDEVTLDDVTLETLQMARRVLNSTFVRSLFFFSQGRK